MFRQRICASRRYLIEIPAVPPKKIIRISKFVPPPTPPYFAMYMQTKGLRRSVGDRYANKGLK